MVRLARWPLSAALCTAWLFAAGATSRAQNPAPDSAARAVQKLFAGWVDSSTPGCAVGASRNGRVLYENGFGLANLETRTPITPRTVFEAASIAKQFTAMAVMLLARDGKLSFDDDIRKYIPELPDYGTRVTIRHLLTHTSGLRDFFEMLILARGRFEEDRVTEADMMDIVTRQKALNFTPGDEYLYSNTGYALLGIIVKRVAGQSLRDFAAARIFAPLGMSSSRFRDSYTTLVAGRAEGYARRGSEWRSSTPNFDVYGSTNLFSTVGDLLTWSENLDHPRVGDSSIVRAMSTSGVLNNGDSTSYGFGLSLWNDRGTMVVEHEGGDPGFRSYLGRYPEFGFSVAVLCNIPSNPVALGHEIADIYLNRPRTPQPPLSVKTIALPADKLARRAGIYFQPTRLEIVEVTMRDGALFTARNGGRKLLPIDENRFWVEGTDVEHDFNPTGYTARALSPGHHPVSFELKSPTAIMPGKLASYAGDYFSRDLNTVYQVTASDSTLSLKTGTSNGLTARPMFEDTFASGQITIQFVRRANKITGFEISHPRARRLTFQRIAGTVRQ
jgi:CubicO group peptidase (beta-lactamase class C family)